MLRCTIDLLPFGSEEDKRTVGVVEIGNVGGGREVGNYRVILKKSKPFSVSTGSWRTALTELADDLDRVELEDAIVGKTEGFERLRLGPYDLLFRALAACGLLERNPLPVRTD